MITIYKSTETGLATIDQPVSGCWVSLVDPSPEETAQIARDLNIPHDFLVYPLDMDERARTEKDNGVTLIVLRVPRYEGASADVPYLTIPLGIIITDSFVLTVCKYDSSVLQGLRRAPILSTGKRNRFILRVLRIAATTFLDDLRLINNTVDRIEERLQHSQRNRELMELLKYQKSLVYFTTALKSNELILQHLQKYQLFHQYPDDLELLEDVLTDVQQAIEMTNISSNILSQMMDAFASIISNNLNVVLKFLASVTIIMSVPTMVASFYGMNVPLPLQEWAWAFPTITAACVLLCVAMIIVFLRKDWL